MRPSFRFEFVLAATLLACVGFRFYVRAQTGSPDCHADGSPRDESGLPHCCADGSPPYGNECWCDPQIVRGDYRNPEREYEVHVPDGIAEILGCVGIGNGFKVSLAHPESGNGDWLNMIYVWGSEENRETFQSIADHWSQQQREDSERVHATDLQLDPPQQISLSSLPALHLKRARTELESGRMVFEVIIANNPEKGIVYRIIMITRANQYEKNERLFKKVVDGFRYTPAAQRW